MLINIHCLLERGRKERIYVFVLQPVSHKRHAMVQIMAVRKQRWRFGPLPAYVMNGPDLTLKVNKRFLLTYRHTYLNTFSLFSLCVCMCVCVCVCVCCFYEKWITQSRRYNIFYFLISNTTKWKQKLKLKSTNVHYLYKLIKLTHKNEIKMWLRDHWRNT